MRLLNKLPHPKYFFIPAIISFCMMILMSPTGMIEPVNGFHTSWSPDGRKMGIIAVVDGRDHEVFVVDANGQKLQLLATDGGGIESMRWSPDSDTLYYWMPPLLPAATLYKVNLQPHNPYLSLWGYNAVSANDYPVATQDEIDTSIVNPLAETYYTTSVCSNLNRPSLLTYIYPELLDESYDYVREMNCWHDLKVYSVETDELLWKIGRYKYRAARFGILATFGPGNYFNISILAFGLGIMTAILRRFRKPDNRKRKPKVQGK